MLRNGKPETIQVAFTLPVEVERAVQQAAEADHRSRSQMFAVIVQQWFDRRQEEKEAAA